jgi:hypothetical protein
MSTAKRATLQLAKPPKRVTYARIRQAVRLFRKGYGSRQQRKNNAAKWLTAIDSLGPKWVYAESVRLSKKGT